MRDRRRPHGSSDPGRRSAGWAWTKTCACASTPGGASAQRRPLRAQRARQRHKRGVVLVSRRRVAQAPGSQFGGVRMGALLHAKPGQVVVQQRTAGLDPQRALQIGPGLGQVPLSARRHRLAQQAAGRRTQPGKGARARRRLDGSLRGDRRLHARRRARGRQRQRGQQARCRRGRFGASARVEPASRFGHCRRLDERRRLSARRRRAGGPGNPGWRLASAQWGNRRWTRQGLNRNAGRHRG